VEDEEARMGSMTTTGPGDEDGDIVDLVLDDMID